MPDTKPTLEESFKESLEDVKTIVEKLLETAPTTEDLLAQVNLALENEHHMRLLMAYMQAPKLKK